MKHLKKIAKKSRKTAKLVTIALGINPEIAVKNLGINQEIKQKTVYFESIPVSPSPRKLTRNRLVFSVIALGTNLVLGVAIEGQTQNKIPLFLSLSSKSIDTILTISTLHFFWISL